MKTMFVIALAFLASTAFADIRCVGKTFVEYEDGTRDTVQTKLKKVINDRSQVVYYAESHLFKFWVLHELKGDLVTLEIMSSDDALVVHAPRMKLAMFSVSAGGYWKEDFSSLECSPSVK